MENQRNNGAEYLYALSVLTKMFTSGVIGSKVYEKAVRKAKIKFDKNSFAA